MSTSLHFASIDRTWLDPYLPSQSRSRIGDHNDDIPPGHPHESASTTPPTRPFVTLTYATSLDAALTHARGHQTALSGPRSKAMTHYLRSTHDAILIGTGTAVSDDPALNCRLTHHDPRCSPTRYSQPRPVIIDPSARWTPSRSSRLFAAVRADTAKAPWVVCVRAPSAEKRAAIEAIGGRYIVVDPRPQQTCPTLSSNRDSSDAATATSGCHIAWSDIFGRLHGLGIRSVMVEGGARVIGSLLASENCHLLDSVIVTLAPVWLGVDPNAGVLATPDRSQSSAAGHAGPTGGVRDIAALADVAWHQLGDDVVLCARVKKSQGRRVSIDTGLDTTS